MELGGGESYETHSITCCNLATKHKEHADEPGRVSLVTRRLRIQRAHGLLSLRYLRHRGLARKGLTRFLCGFFHFKKDGHRLK